MGEVTAVERMGFIRVVVSHACYSTVASGRLLRLLDFFFWDSTWVGPLAAKPGSAGESIELSLG